MEKELISVIVPVYNSKKYLKKSICSLIEQTIFDKLEIIFIDDGSTDDGYKTIEEYCNLYSNIKLYRQDNQGVSSARNKGISMASGKYLVFFDADDIAKPRLYEKLYQLINLYDADISIVDYSMVFEDNARKKHRVDKRKLWENRHSLLVDFFSTSLICTNPVDKMFRTEKVKDVLFPEGYRIGEDMYYVYKALQHSDRVILDSTESLYDYIIHSESAMKQSFSMKHMDSVALAKKIYEDCVDNTNLKEYAYANYIHETCKMLGLIYKSGVQDKYVDVVAEHLRILKSYNIRLSLRYLSIKHVIALQIMKHSPRCYVLIYSLLRIG